jgi:hypothetical protein
MDIAIKDQGLGKRKDEPTDKKEEKNAAIIGISIWKETCYTYLYLIPITGIFGVEAFVLQISNFHFLHCCTCASHIASVQ